MRAGVGKAGGVAALVAACAFAAPTSGAPPAGEPVLEVELLRTSQAKIAATGRLRVALRATWRSRATVTAYARAGGRERRITKRRVVPVGKRTRKAGVRLNARGKRVLARCQARTLTVHGDALFEGDILIRGDDEAQLRLDLPQCAPPTSKRTYEVAPDEHATHANGTARDLTAGSLGGAAVRLATFACDTVAEADGELAFTAQGDVAHPGDPPAWISAVDGVQTTGSPQQTEPTGGGSDEVAFKIDGANGCALAVAYHDANGNGGLDVDEAGIPTERYGGGGRTTFEPQGVAFQDPGRCDPLDPAVCLQPFPNDQFTVADGATATGKRLALNSASMPKSNLEIGIDPTEQNRSDGFSPGSLLITRVPGLDTPQAFAQTDPVPITNVERSYEPDAPVVVIDADTGERHLIWTELDANPANPADVNLLIRPAVNFEEGHRYVVALRDLRDAGGNVIAPQRPFELYRDRVITSDQAVERRRGHFEDLFATLGDAGIARDDLYLAWDFTVASERSLTERMLAIRDDAFATLGDHDLADMQIQGSAPTTVVTNVTDYLPCGSDGCQPGLQLPSIPIAGPLLDPVLGLVESVISPLLGMAPEDDRIMRKVQGEIVVPCYTNLPLCPPGSQFSYSGPGDTIPDRIPGNVTLAAWECLVPRSVTSGGELHKARPSLYGHGLLGAHTEVEAGNVKAMANEHNFVFCATDWAGFAQQDLPTIALNLQDLSHFAKIADRTQQGFLNFLFLGRAMIHPNGLGSHPAFQFGGQSVLDRERLFYDGNSQGGIFGGALTAVAPDFDRAVLGVPGMNYSTLLRRSVDFEPYAEGEFVPGLPDLGLGLYDRYPNELERPLVLALIQILWDRGEANGYAHHMTSDPPRNTPPHEVLMQVAFGDHQVSMWTAEVEARTVGAATNPLPLDPGRHPDSNVLFGIPRITDFATTPYDGSALIYYDSGPPSAPGATDGVVPPPITNVPPRPPEYGGDPHSHPRSDAQARVQKSRFMRVGGKVVDVCGGGPCYANGYTGAP